MATIEPEIKAEASASPATEANAVSRKRDVSILDKFLGLLSSVRFGIVMLMILLACCMIGMLIMQKDVDGFMEYYNRLTPSQRTIWGNLGFFDIYHSWYFGLFLAITGLNIILASIDRFPTAWQYVIKPKLMASPNFIRAQMFNRESVVNEEPGRVASRIVSAWRNHPQVMSSTMAARLGVLGAFAVLAGFLIGLLPRGVPLWISMIVCGAVVLIYVVKGLRFDVKVTEEDRRMTVFAQSNVWNRLGAYIVHVGLLTIFIGGLLTVKMGSGGMMQITPGESTSVFDTFEMTLDGPKMGKGVVPFQVECTDLQQKLIRPEGGLDSSNTIDWLSFVRIKDGAYQRDEVVHLNNPVDYRGYRFFQSKFDPIGNARSVTISFEPLSGGGAKRVTIPRDSSVSVEGIGQVAYKKFYSHFEPTGSEAANASPDYVNPVVELEVVGEGRSRRVMAFNPQMLDVAMKNSDKFTDKTTGENPLLVAGHKVVLRDFEKVGTAHILAVQYDPGRIPFYVGSTLLVGALLYVFFLSHQRVWAVIEPDGKGSKVYFGGNTNRNRPAFETRFNMLVESVVEEERKQ
ncbi:MAG: cytochrome c biogenesis protein ResB [Acidobacteriota bacterium]